MRRALPAAVLVLLAACAHQAPPPPASPTADARADGPAAPPALAAALQEIRTDVDALLASQAEAYWRAWTAGERVDLSASWRGRQRLLAPATLATVTASLQRAHGDERRALAWLRAFLLGERLSRETAGAATAAAGARTAATFTWDGKEVSARQVPAVLAAEPDAARRRTIAEAYAATAKRWLALVDARQERLRAAVHALGFADTLALAGELRGADPAALAALAEALLARTDDVYRALLDEVARRELSMPLASLRERDLPRLFRSTLDPRTFPADRQLPAVVEVLSGLGIDLATQKNLALDVEPRPDKVTRPIALPVEVPQAIRLAFTPVAGLDAARALLHEVGVAEASAHATTPVMEFRRLGPRAVPEAWALLMESVADSPEWLGARGLQGERLRDVVRTAAARRLHQVREAAARVLFEVARVKEPARAAELWTGIAERAFAHPIDGAGLPVWRTDPDPLLHAADTLRAGLVAAQAEVFLAHEAGEAAWWRSRKAGAWLEAAWADGTGRTPEELALAMGQPGLDAGALEALVRARARL